MPFLSNHVARTRLTAIAASGDLTLVTLFVVLGATMGHGEDPVAQGGDIAMTAISFLTGWTLAALATRAYAPGWAESLPSVAGRTVLAWVVAVLIALALRSTQFFPGNVALSFALVATGVGLALLGPWRVGLAIVARQTGE
ncbi:DUF3054 domain-containing protein [Halococcoides cellulosivorans]|uniref:DUF3054 domain-containing protein n=1 Tax=Halococcoides cellulosivorans TaxID=1679096 RepID=A0A2R4X013_9EURY|nr:DUF3054 domain-containing protein [Halococcoides cellulosivorans]AWB27111.1 DUF3054 domain-containing protein [Halococcoides cellulosivorans]